MFKLLIILRQLPPRSSIDFILFISRLTSIPRTWAGVRSWFPHMLFVTSVPITTFPINTLPVTLGQVRRKCVAWLLAKVGNLQGDKRTEICRSGCRRLLSIECAVSDTGVVIDAVVAFGCVVDRKRSLWAKTRRVFIASNFFHNPQVL